MNAAGVSLERNADLHFRYTGRRRRTDPLAQYIRTTDPPRGMEAGLDTRWEWVPGQDGFLEPRRRGSSHGKEVQVGAMEKWRDWEKLVRLKSGMSGCPSNHVCPPLPTQMGPSQGQTSAQCVCARAILGPRHQHHYSAVPLPSGEHFMLDSAASTGTSQMAASTDSFSRHEDDRHRPVDPGGSDDPHRHPELTSDVALALPMQEWEYMQDEASMEETEGKGEEDEEGEGDGDSSSSEWSYISSPTESDDEDTRARKLQAREELDERARWLQEQAGLSRGGTP